MNLKQRIKKIEDQLPKTNAMQCQCWNKHNLALMNQAYGEPFETKDLMPPNAPIEGTCIRCGKEISPQVKEYFEMIELCYGDRKQ